MTIAEDYVVSLPNTKAKFYDTMGWLLIIIHLTAFSTLAYYVSNAGQRGYALVGILLIAIPLVFEWFFRKPHQKSTVIQSALTSGTLVWLLFLHYYTIGFFSLALTLLFYIARRDMKVLVNKERIEYPSFPPRKIKWTELNNIILKDGLLTIDFKNNKLIQQLIDENTQVNETGFNQYCQEQLAAKMNIEN
jgi:hypothetical protein